MKGNLGAALLALAALPSAAWAGGLYVPGQGPISSSRAGADVAAADDPSAIATNPAGLAETSGTVVIVGSNFLDYSLAFTRRGAYEDTANDYPWEGNAYARQTNGGSPKIGIGPFQALPELAAVFDLGSMVPGLHVAIGLFVPNSFPTRDFGSSWTLNEDDLNNPSASNAPPPSRYDVVKQDAAIIMPAIAAAYRVNKLVSVGGRFTPAISNVEATSYTWGDANYSEDTQHDSVFHVKAKDSFTPEFGLGVQLHATDAIDVGANWDSQLDVHNVGTGDAVSGRGLDIAGMPPEIDPVPDDMVRCAKGGKVGALAACVDLGLPMVTTVGGRYKMLDEAGGVKGDVELDVAWERWSAVSDYTVTVDGAVLNVLPLSPSLIKHNFQDVISTRLGGSYHLPVGAGLTVRGGLAYDTAAAKPGWERLDIDGAARTTVGVGAGYGFGKYEVNVGAGYSYEGSRDVGGNCNPTAAMPGCGKTDGNGNPIDDNPNDRPGPDPIQPLNAGTPFESPMNAGKYESGYLLLSFAVVAKF